MSSVAVGEVEREPDCWTRDYWLRHCEGYAVVTPGGRVGFVEEIVWAADGSEPVEFKIRGGTGIDYHTFVLPLEHVTEVRPSAERIVVEDARKPGARAETSRERRSGGTPA